VVGIATTTAALVILLSAFNGIESMIEGLYSDYDTDVTVRVIEGKSFNENRIDLEKIRKIEGVENVTRAVEEVVILKHEKKWVNAKMIGVDSSFLEIAKMEDHMVYGEPEFYQKGKPRALIGASLLDKLDGFIPKQFENESVICYVPKKNIKIRPGKSPFNMQIVELSGSVNFNREVNAESFILPIDLGKELLGYVNQISVHFRLGGI